MEEANMDAESLRAAIAELDVGSAFSQAMASEFLQKNASSPEKIERVTRWLQCTTSPLPVLGAKWQRGCPELIPGLTASPVWAGLGIAGGQAAGHPPLEESGSQSPAPSASLQAVSEAVALLESKFEAIKSELLGLRGRRLFQRYRAPDYSQDTDTTVEGGQAASSQNGRGAAPSGPVLAGAGGPADLLPDPATPQAADREDTPQRPGPKDAQIATGTAAGDWNVMYLDLHNVDCSEARAACPVTVDVLSRLPRPYGHAMFSALAPLTHITTHTGPTNKKLRIQLPLVAPSHPRSDANDGGQGQHTALYRLRVGPHVVPLHEGRAIVFDDSHQHEAWNDSDEVRIVLIVDIWHPDLTEPEVKFLDFVRKAQMRKAAALSKAGHVPERADFYKILEKQRQQRTDDDVVFGAPVAVAGQQLQLGDAGAVAPGPDGPARGQLEPQLYVPVRDD